MRKGAASKHQTQPTGSLCVTLQCTDGCLSPKQNAPGATLPCCMTHMLRRPALRVPAAGRQAETDCESCPQRLAPADAPPTTHCNRGRRQGQAAGAYHHYIRGVCLSLPAGPSSPARIQHTGATAIRRVPGRKMHIDIAKPRATTPSPMHAQKHRGRQYLPVIPPSLTVSLTRPRP